MERLRAGLVVTLAADAVHRLGLQNEGALRLYAYLRSQARNPRMDRIGAATVEQIVRPASSWGLARRPAKFRAAVRRMADAIMAADPTMHLAIRPASREAGGWMLTWS
jgi:hypothetical protein